jgi:hypothetical protein
MLEHWRCIGAALALHTHDIGVVYALHWRGTAWYLTT